VTESTVRVQSEEPKADLAPELERPDGEPCIDQSSCLVLQEEEQNIAPESVIDGAANLFAEPQVCAQSESESMESPACALDGLEAALLVDQEPCSAKKVSFLEPKTPSSDGQPAEPIVPEVPEGPETIMAGGLFARHSQRQSEFIRNEKMQEQQRLEQKETAEREKVRRKKEETKVRRERLGMGMVRSPSAPQPLPAAAAAAIRPRVVDELSGRRPPQRRPGQIGAGTGSSVRLAPIKEYCNDEDSVEIPVAEDTVDMGRHQVEAGPPPSSAERNFQGMKLPDKLPALREQGLRKGAARGLPAHVARNLRGSSSLPAIGAGADEALEDQKSRVAQKMAYLCALSEQHDKLVSSMSGGPGRPRQLARLRQR